MATPAALMLIVQDPKTRAGIPVQRMEVEYPRAYAYLKRFEKMLRERAAYKRYFDDKDAFWTMFNIGEYTFTRWKVAWGRVANEVSAAAVGPQSDRIIVSENTCNFIPVDSEAEAHYVTAVMNSAPFHLTVRQYIIMHPDPHILKNVRVPKFDPKTPLHGRLSRYSMRAHELAARAEKDAVAKVEEEIDVAAAELWGLSAPELAEIKDSLADLA